MPNDLDDDVAKCDFIYTEAILVRPGVDFHAHIPNSGQGSEDQEASATVQGSQEGGCRLRAHVKDSRTTQSLEARNQPYVP